MNNTMVKAIIFDLDNCLAPAVEVGEALFRPVFEAIRRENAGALSEERLEQAFADIWRHPFDWVADHYGFSKSMLNAGWEAFITMEVDHPMRGYGDLEFIKQLPAKCFLVTSGFRKLQESKIKALDMQNLFQEMYVDAIDEPDRLGKQGLFEKILRESHFTNKEVLVVGDNPDSEIKAGNRLGMHTVQTLRPGVTPSNSAKSHIRSLAELKQFFPETARPVN